MTNDWDTEEMNTPIFDNFENKEKTKIQKFESLVDEVTEELRMAHKEKYEIEKAERTAALCLEAQKELTDFLSDLELFSKEKKLEVERIESEKYFHYKETASDKLTEVALKHLINKDIEVLNAKKIQFKEEANFTKCKNLFSIMKESHVFFRNVSRGKNEWN